MKSQDPADLRRTPSPATRVATRHSPVAVKALLSVGHGTPVLPTGGKLLGAGQLSLDLGWWRAMKHHWTEGETAQSGPVR